MKKAFTWKRNDKITATRLNSMSCALNCLLDNRAANLSCKSRAQGNTSNDGSTQEQVQPQKYDLDTALFYRHPYLGTADIVGDEESGFYATPPAIIRADGESEYQGKGAACLIPSCRVPAPCGQGKDTLYIQLATDSTGEIVGTPFYTWEKAETHIYGINRGGGVLQYPVAKVLPNPKYPCEKVTLNSHAPALPIIADDASYIPPHVTGARHVQTTKWVDEIDNAVIPVRGFINRGGIKYIATERSGKRVSNSFEASIEMYGVAGKDEPCTYPLCGVCVPVGTGRGDFPPPGSGGIRLYQPYNACQPYKISGDGKLAGWKIYDGNGEQTGELVLNGLHICDWQLAYKGDGEIRLPKVHCFYASPAHTTDIKHEFGAYTEGGKNYLTITEYERQECFGVNGKTFYNTWGEWQEKTCMLVELGGGTPVGSHGLQLHTLAGSAPQGCFSRWCDMTLHLVQIPVVGTHACSGCEYVAGYKLV